MLALYIQGRDRCCEYKYQCESRIRNKKRFHRKQVRLSSDKASPTASGYALVIFAISVPPRISLCVFDSVDYNTCKMKFSSSLSLSPYLVPPKQSHVSRGQWKTFTCCLTTGFWWLDQNIKKAGGVVGRRQIRIDTKTAYCPLVTNRTILADETYPLRPDFDSRHTNRSDRFRVDETYHSDLTLTADT